MGKLVHAGFMLVFLSTLKKPFHRWVGAYGVDENDSGYNASGIRLLDYREGIGS